jgi:hypothetical protein
VVYADLVVTLVLCKLLRLCSHATRKGILLTAAACSAATISGCMKLGLNLLLVSVHPMKPGATLMNAFLFNTALILLATSAAIQFCATAFGLYASVTSINDIYGNQASGCCRSAVVGVNATC